jgi:hypothetical protein
MTRDRERTATITTGQGVGARRLVVAEEAGEETELTRRQRMRTMAKDIIKDITVAGFGDPSGRLGSCIFMT